MKSAPQCFQLIKLKARTVTSDLTATLLRDLRFDQTQKQNKKAVLLFKSQMTVLQLDTIFLHELC